MVGRFGFSKGVFRKISRRHYQKPAYRFVIPAPTAAVAAVGHDYLAAMLLLRKQLGRRPKLPDVRWQLQRRFIPSGVFVAPAAVSEPGFLAATAQLRTQLGRQYALPDVRWQLRKPAHRWVVETPSVFTPGFLESIASQRRQLGLERVEVDVRPAQRRFVPYGVTPPPPPVEAPGWSAEIQRRRAILQSLVRRDPWDVRWQLHRRHVVQGRAQGVDIGWLVSYMVRRAYGHNLRR